VAAGSAAVVLENTSEDDTASSGAATAHNEAAVGIGGSDRRGDAINGLVQSGPRLYINIGVEGDVSGTVEQTGDNEVDLTQGAAAGTGDAVGGGQVTGLVVGAGGDVALDATNASQDSDASSGNSTSHNTAAACAEAEECVEAERMLLAGPYLDIVAEFGASGSASILQEGDNDLAAAQVGDAMSGDGVAGAQIVGAVVSGTADVVLDNTSEDDESGTGTVTDRSDTRFVHIGPRLEALFLDDEDDD
jgi:hypothetical protein